MSITLPQFGPRSGPGAELDHAGAQRRFRPNGLAWIGIGLAASSLILVIANIVLGLINQSAQARVERRQQFIAATAPLGRIDNALIVTIAKAAATHHDEALNATLNRAGVTYRIKPVAMPPKSKGTTP